MAKTAVVLLNLGGPLKREDIKPFLFNFFMDKNIIRAPKPVRWLLAQYISRVRGRGAALESYSHLGFCSPLLGNTRAQAGALQAALGDDYAVFVSMRYWHPLAPDVVQQIRKSGVKEIVLLPLYPQFSTTTSYSSFENWEQAARAGGLELPTRRVCCYPDAEGFIEASARLVRRALAAAPAGTRVLFSAHGLPQKVIDDGDPYQWQCEDSARRIAAAAGLDDWQICYQSRVGPLKWIGPSTEEALQQAARDGRGVVVYPHAFVSEHVETLVEIEMEYREMAEHLHIPYFARVPTVAEDTAFIGALAALVRGGVRERICPATCSRCACDMQGAA